MRTPFWEVRMLMPGWPELIAWAKSLTRTQEVRAP